MLGPLGIDLLTQSELHIEGAAETAVTFVENALAKARHASRSAGLPAIADDSGLCVAALNGAPGVHSARYAGPDATDEENNRKLIRMLANHEHPRAYFFCVTVYLAHADDPMPLISSGRWDGEITSTARGANGFGYDPHFLLADGRTAAELPADEKNRASHRGQAVAGLIELLESRWR